MAQKVSHKWQPLTDLSAEDRALALEELRALHALWEEQRDTLEQTGGMQTFKERLCREWAIETGIIERMYSLDRGVTELLIKRGIDENLIAHDQTDTSPQLVTTMIRDHQSVVEGLFTYVKGDRELSTSYVKELHAEFCRHQDTVSGRDQFGAETEAPLQKGAYKQHPNSPTRPDGSIHEYCPPEQVASEMDRLIGLHCKHTQEGVPPEVEAAWLHHRFTQIHPFQDGNGRVARALASLVFMKAGWFPPLTVTRDHKEPYLDALAEADRSDLAPLVRLFAAIQRKALTRALSIAGSVGREKQVDHVIDSIRDMFETRQKQLQEKWAKAKSTAAELLDVAVDRLRDVISRLDVDVAPYIQGFTSFVSSEPAGGERSHYFRFQVIQAARKLGYFASLAECHSWARLVLKVPEQAEILVSFHGLGHEYRGIVAASMCFFAREATEDGERQIGDVAAMSNDLFQVNYLEDTEGVRERFVEWMNEGLVEALDMWRKGL